MTDDSVSERSLLRTGMAPLGSRREALPISHYLLGGDIKGSALDSPAYVYNVQEDTWYSGLLPATQCAD